MRHLRHSILYLHCQTLVVWLILILLIRAGTLAPSAWYEWVAASVLFVLPFGFYQWYGDTEAWRRLFCLMDGEPVLRKRLTQYAWRIHESESVWCAGFRPGLNGADTRLGNAHPSCCARDDLRRLVQEADAVGIKTGHWTSYIQRDKSLVEPTA